MVLAVLTLVLPLIFQPRDYRIDAGLFVVIAYLVIASVMTIYCGNSGQSIQNFKKWWDSEA